MLKKFVQQGRSEGGPSVTFSPAQPRAAEQLISHVWYVEGLNDARTMLGESASLGKEAVLAASGRAGEIVAGVGRVR